MEKNYKKLCPFKGWALENFPFIEADFDAITNYELLCKIIEYLNKTSSQFNDIIDNINYLNNWFNSLNLQDEVDNKLDEMVESGQLQEIIASYLNANALWCFDNIQGMKNATNLIDGSFAKTLGYYSVNDEGSSLYKIREITNEDVVDEMFIIALNDTNLVAELVPINNTIGLKQLGLVGDGTTDETTKLKKAFSSTYNIYVNSGTYITNDTINVNNSCKISGKNNHESVIKAKAGMTIDTSLLKLNADNTEVYDLGLSGNIAENPIGDIYNDQHGISLIDIANSSNISIHDCYLYDDAYGAIRTLCFTASDTISLIKVYNNEFYNVDCGYICLSGSDHIINLNDVYIYNNVFNGHSKSEPISIYHYGTAKNINIYNNVIYNKQNASGIYIGRSGATTVTDLNINNNIIYDVSAGIRINSVTNGNINNNQIYGKDGNINEGLIINSSSYLNINNNTFKKNKNNCIYINSCNHIYLLDNTINDFNVNNDSNRYGIRITSSSYISSKNNIVNEHVGSANSWVYDMDGSCSYIFIDENNNESKCTGGFYLQGLSSALTNSKIITNLGITGNFNTSYLNDSTNTIKQTYSTDIDTIGLKYGYKFAREINVNNQGGKTVSTMDTYTNVNFTIYTFNISAGADIILTSDSVSANGIIWKTDRTIANGTKTQIKLMYISGKLYEI